MKHRDSVATSHHAAIRLALGAALIAGSTGAAVAAVVDVGASGLTVEEKVTIAAPPAKTYDALVHPERWWNPAHTFSGDAANLTLEAIAGGCFCETLPHGGSVRHLVVFMSAPEKQLVMRGALGPFQTLGIDGALNVTLAANGDGTDLSLTYALGGYTPKGFAEWAPMVDAMLAEQVGRLKRFVETGAADGG